MKIDPIRLKELRQRAGLSRKQLAAESNVSPKQIQRLENIDHPSRTTRRVTIDRLAAALKVKPDVLTGDEPLPHTDPFEAATLWPPSKRVNHRHEFGTVLAFDLIEKRYGIGANAIVNAAPLFFVLLAEGSLAWRRKKLFEIREEINNIERLRTDSNRQRYLLHNCLAENDSCYEEQAIEQKDLFNDPFPYNYRFEVDDGVTTNPFVEYLQHLSRDLNVPGIEVGDGFVWLIGFDDMPRYSVCADILKEIAQDDSQAQIALQGADVRIADIPEQLSPDGTSEEREEWLANKVSKKTARWHEEWEGFRKLLHSSDVDTDGSGRGKGTAKIRESEAIQ